MVSKGYGEGVLLSRYLPFAVSELLRTDMSLLTKPTDYDSCWAAYLVEENGSPSYPDVLPTLLERQHPDGGWGSRVSHSHDRLLSTLAVVLLLARFGNRRRDKERQTVGEHYIWSGASELDHDGQATDGFEPPIRPPEALRDRARKEAEPATERANLSEHHHRAVLAGSLRGRHRPERRDKPTSAGWVDGQLTVGDGRASRPSRRLAGSFFPPRRGPGGPPGTVRRGFAGHGSMRDIHPGLGTSLPAAWPPALRLREPVAPALSVPSRASGRRRGRLLPAHVPRRGRYRRDSLRAA